MDPFQKPSKTITTWMLAAITITLLLFVGKMVYPNATNIVLNTLWFVFFSITIIFIIMGILIIFGLKKEVSTLLDMILEGSFSVLDFIQALKDFFALLKKRVKELLLIIAPVFSYVLAVAIYLMFLYLYKLVGKYYDVTLLTVFLTVFLFSVIGIFTKPNLSGLEKRGWKDDFFRKIKTTFTDSLEVVVFIFFLTMDSTKLFFVPEELNVPLEAKVFGFNLMARGFTLDHAKVTLTIIIIAITTEIIRNMLRIIVAARKYYLESLRIEPWEIRGDKQRYLIIKDSIRKSFGDAKDDLLKFITFTTVLLMVFIAFPRLKLLSMAVASLTSFVLDLLIVERLSSVRENDLISRILTKIFLSRSIKMEEVPNPVNIG